MRKIITMIICFKNHFRIPKQKQLKRYYLYLGFNLENTVKLKLSTENLEKELNLNLNCRPFLSQKKLFLNLSKILCIFT